MNVSHVSLGGSSLKNVQGFFVGNAASRATNTSGGHTIAPNDEKLNLLAVVTALCISGHWVLEISCSIAVIAMPSC